MKKIIYILLLFPTLLFSQEELKGMIMEANDRDEHIGLSGANVIWLDTTIGAVTDLDGNFSIPYKETYKKVFFVNSF